MCWWFLFDEQLLPGSLSGNFTVSYFLGFSSFPSVAFPSVPQGCFANCASRQRKRSVTFFTALEKSLPQSLFRSSLWKKEFPPRRQVFLSPKPQYDIPSVLSAHISLLIALISTQRCLCEGFLYQWPKLSLPTGRQRRCSRPFLFRDERDFWRELCCSPNFMSEIVLEKNKRTLSLIFKVLCILFFKPTSILPSLGWSKLACYFKDIRLAINIES